MTCIVRALTEEDAEQALALYGLLSTGSPLQGSKGKARFCAVLGHPGTTIFGAVSSGVLKSMLTLHLMPNVTNSGRPYALIENVVTATDARGQGFATAVMQAAIAEAWAKDAYKIMLLTGRGNEARTFYEKQGFTAEDKWGMTLRRPD